MGTLRVMVVDDFAGVADGLSSLLRRWGHTSRAAYSGPQALAVARKFRPDVALLDLGLPRMDGYEVGRRLRQLPGLGGLRLLAVTGRADAEYERRSQEAGFAGMVKPLNFVRLKKLLDVLAREKARRPQAP
jgi:CheY-like chemotaxis protein